MEMLDCRRLTGPNAIWDRPGAVIDVSCDDDQAGKAIAGLAELIEALLATLDWQAESIAARKCIGGFSLAISAPMDALYAATEILEAAWQAFNSEIPVSPEGLASLREAIEEEANTNLIALTQSAANRAVTLLSDDDEVSLGLGCKSKTWPVRNAPAPESLEWEQFGDVPVGLVTGTNGKTTSSRLAANMVAAANLTCGLTSTDWMAVAGEIIDEGDYAGPGGARTVLRDRRVEVAVLETARGGLLRRGLAVQRANAALITNISEDHLGDFGSRSLDELLEIKWAVSRALTRQDLLILNAEDPLLVAQAARTGLPICYFSPDPETPVLAAHAARGGHACTVIDGDFARRTARGWMRLAKVSEAPITFGGAARHNVANALGAIGLAHALGIPDKAIRAGLLNTRRGDNPGRCNLYLVDGIQVLVDFAHNVDAMQALFHLAHELDAGRRFLCMGQAGDRPDQDIAELAQSAWRIGLDMVVISELEKYYRGREPNEVFNIMRTALLESGANPHQIEHCDSEMQSLELAIERAQPGDLVIMLALADSADIRAWLKDKEQHDAS